MPRRARYLSFSLALLGAGCSTVDFSAESRRRIRTVVIDDLVAVEADYHGHLDTYEGDSQSAIWHASFEAQKESEESAPALGGGFHDHLLSSGVDVASITRQELVRYIEGTHIFESVRGREGDAVLTISIDYGISDALGLRGAWKPWLGVTAVLRDHDGNVHWRASEAISSYDERLHEIERPLIDTDRLAIAFRGAARILAGELARRLVEG